MVAEREGEAVILGTEVTEFVSLRQRFLLEGKTRLQVGTIARLEHLPRRFGLIARRPGEPLREDGVVPGDRDPKKDSERLKRLKLELLVDATAHAGNKRRHREP